MNRQQQIDIITAHMAGKRILMNAKKNPDDAGWIPVAHDEIEFDFRNLKYKIEPRKVTVFIAAPMSVLQSLASGEQRDQTTVLVSNGPISRDGWYNVKATFTEI